MEKKNNTKSLIAGLAVLLVSICLTVGVKTLFHACGIHEDGQYGPCRWAEQAVMAAGIMLSLQSLVLVLFRSPASKKAVSVCIGICAVITALIPNVFIKLCAMPSMNCLSSMQPFTVICCVVIVILCLIHLLISRKETNN